MGFVDLHAHVLPALDDGAQRLEDSLTLLGLLERMGFSEVYATPHQKVGAFVPGRAAIDAAHAQVRAEVASRGLSIELYLGAENYWDELFLERARTGAQPTYSGGRAFLVELDPRMTPPRLEETLFSLRVRGLLPVLAHPERYVPLWDDLDRVRAIARTAALVVDLGALAGAHGPKEARAAQRLLRDGLCHAVASDVHSPADAASAGAGIAWIDKRLGKASVTRLLDENPRRILSGELPD